MKNIDRFLRNLVYYTWVIPWSKLLRKSRKSTNNNLYIFAMSRGGSSLLMESLAKALERSATLWEPLADGAKKIKPLRRKNFFLQQYLPKNCKDVEIYHAFDNLLHGRNLNLSMTYHNAQLWTLPFKKHLIFKFCRANLILDYLNTNFSIKPIILLRSPYDSIQSQKGHNAYNALIGDPLFKIPEKTPYKDWYDRYEHIYQECDNVVKHLAIKWCLNVIAIREIAAKDLLIISFEDLIEWPEATYQSIKTYTGLPIDIKQAASNHSKLSVSGTTSPKNTLTKKDLIDIDWVLKQFSLEGVYEKNGKPNINKLFSSL